MLPQIWWLRLIHAAETDRLPGCRIQVTDVALTARWRSRPREGARDGVMGHRTARRCPGTTQECQRPDDRCGQRAFEPSGQSPNLNGSYRLSVYRMSAASYFFLPFLAGAFLAGAFLAGAFLAGAFLAGAFFGAAAFLVLRLLPPT
jgi:hypothetical protein